MRHALPLLFAAAVGVSTAACSDGGPPATDNAYCPADARLTDADRDAIAGGLADAVAAALAGDWAGFAAQFHEDVKMLPPGAPLYTGRDAIVAGFDGVTITEFVSEIDELDGCGDVAFARGHHEWSMQIRGSAAPYSESGKWVAVWRRQGDGDWKVIVDIWNSDSLLR